MQILISAKAVVSAPTSARRKRLRWCGKRSNAIAPDTYLPFKGNNKREGYSGHALLNILFHIFKIELVEMCEPALPAPDGKMPATDREIVGAGDVAIPAFRNLDKFPEIVTPDLYERPLLTYIFCPGHEDPGRPAVIACHLRLVRHGLDDLV
jgi:hypothetical protein